MMPKFVKLTSFCCFLFDASNQNIASAIDLPDTHFLLEYVRPDFLSLRVISKALISWHEVKPTRHWIESQLPVVVRDAYKQMQSRIKKATDFGDLFVAEQESDAGERGGDSMEGEVRDIGSQTSGGATNSRSRQPQDYDCQAVRQIYVHVLAGACFGLGLRFAGTADKRASAAIFERVVELQTLRDANDSVSVAMRPELQILETCLGCCAVSLAMVNAGTGDLEILRLFKILRWRCDAMSKYGTHMSYGIAIGLLFLGGGTCTLGREPEDIAALVAAFFPRFPYSTTDNQYHLQALRHLYALAVKRRELRFIDVDTGNNVQLPVEVGATSSFCLLLS
jgi:anaphase-promoting complex subunit 1